MFDKKKTDSIPESSDFETIVGPSIKIEGDFSGKGNILVQGEINGSVMTDNMIQVEDGAKINANISAHDAIIAGQVTGNITVSSRLDLHSTSKIVGDLEAQVINIQAGASFNGKSTMRGENALEPTLVEDPQQTSLPEQQASTE